MKHEVVILGGQTIDEKLKYNKLEIKHQNLVFTSLECIIKKICHGVKQNAKICAIGETECNEI